MDTIIASFCELPPEEKSGIYLFVSSDYREVYYVGQSINIINRYRTHSVRQFLRSKDIGYTFMWREFSLDALDSTEAAYIKIIKPTLNTVFNKDHQTDLKVEYRKFINRSVSDVIHVMNNNLVLDLDELTDIHSGYDFSNKKDIHKVVQGGSSFLLIKQALVGATVTKPVTLEGLGTFTSFQNFLYWLQDKEGANPSTIKEYVKLAENWHIVLKLNMQDKENVENYGNCMRINRTLKIIRWYEKVEGVYTPEKLTIAQYWLDEEAKLEAARQAKAERDHNEKELRTTFSQLKHDYHNLQIDYQVKVGQYEAQVAKVSSLETRIAELEAQIAKLSSNRLMATVG